MRKVREHFPLETRESARVARPITAIESADSIARGIDSDEWFHPSMESLPRLWPNFFDKKGTICRAGALGMVPKRRQASDKLLT
jgi:hypothetical protein